MENNNKWFAKNWFVILMIIFVFPIGLFLMWKYSTWKKWVKILITVILSIIFLNSFLNNSTPGANNNSTQQEKSKHKHSDKSSSHENNKTSNNNNNSSYKIGDTVKVDKVEFTLTNKQTDNQVGSNGLENYPDGKYVILDVKVKNTGDKALDISESFFKLKNDSKEYETDNSATLTINQDISPDNLGFLGDKINPGSEKHAKVVFDVAPEVAENNNLAVQVQSGYWGTKKEIIKLN